jgi:hypothetical protein
LGALDSRPATSVRKIIIHSRRFDGPQPVHHGERGAVGEAVGLSERSKNKGGLKVSAGPHTVAFVRAEHGRKVRSVTVRPNETATAAVRFP